ncbi:MAG TPA: crosslink repair DNA glycosylase YcaQ family protein [Ktedonobacterales bacterium]|nr:crosslink repair DNA glycosylase YcaQ family protein [Ktedonobacterales bacterium]
MQEDVIRAWWAHRQGLDGSLMGASAAPALAQTGWSRSVGGAGPYVALFARTGLSREAIDAAVAALDIYELPAARGCTYIVPSADFALALHAGQGFGDDAQIVTAKKYCGVTDAEVEQLCHAVLAALTAGPLDPRALKDALGDAVRNLGAEGKKRGTTTTLPLALGKLQSSGEIRRVSTNGRLDQQRYRYARWDGSPSQQVQISKGEAYQELARRYFRWIGPARMVHFQWFSGLSARDAREAIAPLGLVPLSSDDDRLIFPDDLEELSVFRVPTEPHYDLTGGLDNIAHLRREMLSLLPEADRQRRVLGEQGEQILGALSDMPDHPILDRGRLIGFWQYDPEAKAIVWATFDQHSVALSDVVARTEAFIRDELGDMRSFSLDSPESRKPRIAALRQNAHH